MLGHDFDQSVDTQIQSSNNTTVYSMLNEGFN